jgi:transcriptional regulator with XRE-family HTH domain
MQQVQTLIDKAAEMCGSRYKLAKILHEDQGYLSKVANGKRPIGPSLAARLAEQAGVDARTAALASLIALETDPAKRSALARALDMPASPPDWLHINP